MSSNLMDTEAGGEQTQYEGIATHQNPHNSQQGQLDVRETETEATSQDKSTKSERGARAAENIRYGQTISEGGMGGKTTEAEGAPSQDSAFGATKANEGNVNADDSRRIQGYGGGSDIGA